MHELNIISGFFFPLIFLNFNWTLFESINFYHLRTAFAFIGVMWHFHPVISFNYYNATGTVDTMRIESYKKNGINSVSLPKRFTVDSMVFVQFSQNEHSPLNNNNLWSSWFDIAAGGLHSDRHLPSTWSTIKYFWIINSFRVKKKWRIHNKKKNHLSD